MKRNILVLNAGSSSLKYAGLKKGSIVLRGHVEARGRQGTWTLSVGRQQFRKTIPAGSIQTVIDYCLGNLERRGWVPDLVGHRIVHGGGRFHQPTRLTPVVIGQLRAFLPLAPLHMPANLVAVTAVRRTWPAVPQWGVFDTSIYDDLPAAVRTYAIPLWLTKKYHIRKYGFHGISHAWALQQAAQRLGRSTRQLQAVTVHLGAGDSVTAWRQGTPIDTSMGFTPLEGLTMVTRSGDLDPMIPLYLQEHGGFSAKEVEHILTAQSGLFGLTGLRDVRDVVSAAGHPIAGWPRRRWTQDQRHHATMALHIFLYDVQRYLASYLGLLPKAGVIVFTGAIGQNSWIRQQVLRGVPAARGIRVVVVPTDEERAIAEALPK